MIPGIPQPYDVDNYVSNEEFAESQNGKYLEHSHVMVVYIASYIIGL